MSDDDLQYQITQESLENLERELHQLETVERREIADRIRTAREWGDLKENAEYHDAKNAQAHLETKIKRMRERTLNAIVVESAAGAGEIGLGSKVTVRDEDSGAEQAHTLVTRTEADPAQGRVSVDSPLARALLDGKVGDVVGFEAPRGTRRLRILSVD